VIPPVSGGPPTPLALLVEYAQWIVLGTITVVVRDAAAPPGAGAPPPVFYPDQVVRLHIAGVLKDTRSRWARLVERQAVRDARTAVVTDDGEALEAERAHDRDLVVRHRALRVRPVVGRRGRLVARAIAAQVGHDHREVGGQGRSDLVPHDVRLRIAVQQQQRRPVARPAQVDARLAGVDVEGLEAVEHARASQKRVSTGAAASRHSGPS